jgi:hypothetical protein
MLLVFFVISPFLFLVLLIWVFSLILFRLARVYQSNLSFKETIFVLLILYMAFWSLFYLYQLLFLLSLSRIIAHENLIDQRDPCVPEAGVKHS